jgi:hypothetical protein
MSGFVTNERRLVLRVEDYWNYLRENRDFPRAGDIDPVELGEDWCDCFIMRPDPKPAESIFLFVGPRLLENARLPEDWAKASERHVRDCPPGSMLARAVQYFGHVLSQRTPVTVAETFEEQGEEVRLRGTLFPLSSDGRSIDAILGAANCAREECQRIKDSAA